ncbi:hypothetical protein [Dysgonomonas macrotermitis]|uniref:Uncharacterized protein n=1 Tax=Dysgonomonas macrotermitis TaxID=1346286 RepID=A0A1M4Y9X4_9BACT|nr:hypothetical protein [Dysgonomonas macrotermitis]SHF02627.1 hypothetical protein SAMN05444362_103117 [Dysgonomonas macrotermitis]
MKKYLFLLMCSVLGYSGISAAETPLGLENNISIKSPGNPAVTYSLQENNGILKSQTELPLEIRQTQSTSGNVTKVTVTLTAKDIVYYNFEQIYSLAGVKHNDCQFYMPGFWYHRNLRSPEEAPSFHTSDSWQVREDRLSAPLTGIYNDKTGDYYTVLRVDKFENESLTPHNFGETILTDKTSLGFTGFRNINGQSALVFGFPYHEAPKTYIRKLTLNPPIQAFEKLEKGESRQLVWEIRKGNAKDYSGFVADIWNYSYDTFKPQQVATAYDTALAKEILSNFFTESYVDKSDLKYFSGVHMRTDDCKSTGSVEVGFVGRVLLNAFNALEYGEETNNAGLVQKANSIFDSYLKHGFTPNGFIREFVDYTHNTETDIYSIRRQSEGVFAILNYLDYEKKKGRSHPEWESKIKTVLDNILKLQGSDGSFPRKFDDNSKVSDKSGGSTPSATLPLTMAYTYFNNKSYLESAKQTAVYLEKELISKSDYFSSTLDSNCEDKEASLYASTAMYYLSMVTKGKEREHYIDMAKTAAYFCLSWYYVWDLPFAQGQMLGDVGFKSRGWGNVSVENNHIDVFIFEFATVLDWLAKERNEPRFADFSSVIKTSMLQLMPVKGHMFDIGKVGYYPEVVQHTNWDYGKNGKGFYNDIFAPGWTVASLWQMLSPQRVEKYFNYKK